MNSFNKYYAFGMTMPGRNANPGDYRYGFQNQETDPEMFGGAIAFKYRIHDPRIGRFLSIDPLAPDYPWNSPYAFSENRVIDAIELEGRELLDADESRIEITGGIAVMKLENFSSVFNFNFKYLAYPNGNWTFVEYKTNFNENGQITGSTPRGPMVVGQHNFATIAPQANTAIELTDVSAAHGEFMGERPNRKQRRAEQILINKGKIITPVVMPKYGKGMGIGVGVVNLINYSLNTYGAFTIMNDVQSLNSDFKAYEEAKETVEWARDNWCDDYKVDINDYNALNQIMNYVLQGETNGASEEVINVAKDILARTGELKTETTESK